MRRTVCAVIVFLCALPAGARERAHVEDAALRSVYFIDPKEGWAVGDEGVILHTIDGGKTWERQRTGLRHPERAALRSVHFLTPFVGWAVGREELPYGMGSAGVVLFTSDGGLEWKQQLAHTLPGLNLVRFVDQKTGFFLGDGSDQFPAGLFQTTDAGKSWEPVAGPRTTAWLAGDFYDARSGLLAGGSSRLATFRNQKTTLAQHADNLSGRDITALQLLGRKALAVAQGGLILESQSGGAAWGFANDKWSAKLLANLDFHGLHAVKDQVWVVGRPGSVVVHSGDAGKTWKFLKTGQNFPLHAVFFFDERTGWAVGDAGTILHSSDGGQTWASQHDGAKRAAGLCVHARAEDAPVDTLALLGAAEGYLLTTLRVGLQGPAAADARRYAAAVRRGGGLAGESLWHFALPQYLEGASKNALLAHWNESHKGDAGEELLRQLVLGLRIWRPSVVWCDDPHSKAGLGALLGEAVVEAVRRAADPKSFPEQVDELGLQAWQVRKVYAQSAEKDATLTQDNEEAKARLGATVRDYAAGAQALLTDRYVPLPEKRAHRRLRLGDEAAAAERHWFEGQEHPFGETRRDLAAGEKADDRVLETVLQRRNALRQAENLDTPTRTLAMVPVALEKLPDEHAAPAAFAIASEFARRGQWLMAQEVYLYLLDRYPYHPLAAEAQRWLIRLNTSGEARHRQGLKQFAAADPLGVVAKDNPFGKAKGPILQAGHEQPAAAMDMLTSRADVRQWGKGSMEVFKRMSGFGPLYGFEPATQLCLQAARRQTGAAGAAREWFTRFRNFVPSGPYHEAAQAEAWLADRGEGNPRRVGRCRYTEVRPFLDGKFDDPCWQGLKEMALDDAAGDSGKQFPSDVMLAFDQEFLYVALRCQHPAGHFVAPVKPRQTDADLDGFDRVGILLDLDRDYTTCYHLEVDQRGCVRNSCWGDAGWNPRWFVAVHSTGATWQIEAAIPLAELTGERITPATAWAFNIVRVVPGRGVQSWSQPADVRPRPEGMSLLQFHAGIARPMAQEP